MILVLTGACIQPKTSVDDFGTGGRSAVTGDDSEDESDQVEAEPEDEPESALDNSNAKDARVVKPGEAGAPIDATKPRADASAPPIERADAGSEPAPPASTAPTQLSFSVTTASAGGKYAPRNIYAIWVVDAQGKFVKTLAKFARTRQIYLFNWSAASLGNVVDAVTGATLSSHGARSVTWDLTDANNRPVEDGDYKLMLELTDADRTGPSTSISFTKGADAVRLNPPDAPSFTKMSLVLE